MSKSLSSYPEEQRLHVATRRVIAGTGGTGYWGAIAYFDKKKLKYPGKAGAVQAIAKMAKEVTHDERGYTQPDSDRGRGERISTQPHAQTKGHPKKRFGKTRTGPKLGAYWPGRK